MFLTPDQLEALTHYKQPAKQVAALRAMRVPFRVRPDGTPAVASADVALGRQPATMHAGTPQLRLARHGKAA